eukprot:Gb_26885 [translate_table: standard]
MWSRGIPRAFVLARHANATTTSNELHHSKSELHTMNCLNAFNVAESKIKEACTSSSSDLAIGMP